MSRPEVKEKMYITAKKNNSFGKSNIETELYQILKTAFGDVERHIAVNELVVDFYIKSLDIYLQLDGEYWHGIDRDLDVIKSSMVPRDQAIYKTYLRDVNQNNWFKNNGLVLLRITDKHMKNMTAKKLIELISFMAGKN